MQKLYKFCFVLKLSFKAGDEIICSCRRTRFDRDSLCQHIPVLDTVYWTAQHLVFYKVNESHRKTTEICRLFNLLSLWHLHHVNGHGLYIKMIVTPEQAQSSRFQHVHFMRPVEFDLDMRGRFEDYSILFKYRILD
jgi:hypothetical protein